jgi:MFS family permease
MIKKSIKPNPWIMICIAILFYGYEFFLRVSPSVMTKDIILNFNITAKQVGLLSSYYFWAYTPMQIFVGVILDHYKLKSIMFLATISCLLGAWLFFEQLNFLSSSIGRFIIGFGSSFAFVIVLKLAAEWLPTKFFSIISGVTTSLGMMGAISGEYILSKTIKNFGYNNTTNIILFLGATLSILTLLFIQNSKLQKHKNKFIQELLMLTRSVYSVAKNKQLWICAIIGSCLYMPTTFFAGQWAVSYFIDVYHMSNTDAAFASSLLFSGWIVGSPLAAWLSNTLGKRSPLLFIGLIGACLTSMLLLYIKTAFLTNLFLMFFIGVFSSSQILVFAIAHEISESRLVATAVALTNMLTMFGGFIQQLIGFLLDWNNISNIITYTESDYQRALFIMPLCFLIGIIFCFFLKETYCKMQHK